MTHLSSYNVKVVFTQCVVNNIDFIRRFLAHVGMLLVCGGLVNGPYALITTAVSADLVRPELSRDARCLCAVIN